MRNKRMKEYMYKEAMRTNPDYVVYIPESYDGRTNDSHNEHFLVFKGPDNYLMAIWTQSSGKSSEKVNNRIMFSRSDDYGQTWSKPFLLVGMRNGEDNPANMASWGFPMVSKEGRIYVLWTQNLKDKKGWLRMHCGIMAGMYSDDNGKKWSKPQEVPKPLNNLDDPDREIPADWIVWQKPIHVNGKYFVGYTHWVNPKVATLGTEKLKKKGLEGWVWWESVVEFMRFENIDENPEPKNIHLSFSAWEDNALRVPTYREPLLSVAQEPSIVRLPDNRLFCVMRTNTGYIWYSTSEDDGQNWNNPQPLLRKDYGRPILQPVGCCPIYQLSDKRYVLLHHNNRGEIGKESGPRRPAFIALGEYRPEAEQPLWFSNSKKFLDNDGVNPDGTSNPRAQIGTYTSFTTINGKNILWYPDRKCFLLGKEITGKFLKELKVPE